jgi:tripartite-type tricarboxylate transporter receptor subunit TctC
MRSLRAAMILSMIAALTLFTATTSAAQADFPTKPLRLIVPFPPGGGNDILGRAIAQSLSEVIGQAVVVENRAGAGGAIGATAVAQSAPDGYTLLLGSIGNLAHNPALKPDLSYSPERDFAAVTLLATSPFILVVNPSLPAADVRELVTLAKAKPGDLNYCTPGLGSSFHMTTELFMNATGTEMVHVAYKGSAQALAELIAGQTQLSFSTMPPALPHVKSGRLRAVAVTSAQRSPSAPDIPTVSEAGVQGFEVENWQGIVVPKQTPRAIVQKLNRDLVTAMNRPGMVDVLKTQGLEAATTSPEAFDEMIKSEVDKYTKVVKSANIQIK